MRPSPVPTVRPHHSGTWTVKAWPRVACAADQHCYLFCSLLWAHPSLSCADHVSELSCRSAALLQPCTSISLCCKSARLMCKSVPGLRTFTKV